MAVDPDERFSLPDDTDPDDVLRKLLEPGDGDSASDEPDEEPQTE